VWLDQLGGALHRLSCATGDVSECSGRRESKGGQYLGVEYDRCPVRELRDDHQLLYALQLDRQSDVAPLAGWPDRFAAWVPSLVLEVRAARSERFAGQSEGGCL